MTNETLLPPPPNLRGYYAGFVTRLIALLIDLVIIFVMSFLFNWMLRLILNFFGLSSLATAVFDQTAYSPEYGGLLVTVLRWTTTVLTSATFLFVYLVFFWTVIGKTPGKGILGLHVIQGGQATVPFKWAVVRALGYYVSGIPLGLGFFWILIDDERRGWHDRLAHTHVLYEWDARLGRRLWDRIRNWRYHNTADAVIDVLAPPDETIQQ
ncbi:MAG: RDD family protein [Chloroflexota bacterium]